MLSTFQVYFHRIISTLLISTVLFFGIGTLIYSPVAIADSITRDVTNADMDNPVSDAEYESAKVSRQRKQAMRSMDAEAKAERISENETIGEKLNLDEAVPESTKEFIDQITDD